MPILKLRKHQANFSDEDVLINPADFNGLKLMDVVELKPLKGGNVDNRILLQVRKWPETNNYPGSVSIKDSVINNHLKVYHDVLVNIVEKEDVLVDSIEICFSNAYLARSYMWGLRNHLNNRCVYQRQKLDYLHIRSQICEIWAHGDKVSSGYVDDDTKVVFRSASSLVYLFIQMSMEMWDYDINGDLYCEKAINGFLTDLFETWRKNDCSHDITIILFSRTFYDAESIEEFPKEMRECLQVDYKNRFYEDCYRVAFQNDRFDLHDWNAKLTTLKSLFNQYQKEVIDRHQNKYETKIPKAYNSSASQGNFLEVLNMSLNVFEKHYFDRSFDRTGQLSVVVSPGVGVFEVDFEMTNLTKQRIIDNGIGSDLVCLGEQPLHTVPLLKFNSKSSDLEDNLATCDVYNMPHWINLSFYSSQNQVHYSNFIPRIKLPTIHNKLTNESSNKQTLCDNQRNDANCKRNSHQVESANNVHDENIKNRPRHNPGPHFSSHTTIPDLVDYDDYDAQVFKSNSMISYNCQQKSREERSILSDLDANIDYLNENEDAFLDRESRNKSSGLQRRSSDVKNYQEYGRNMKSQQMSDTRLIIQQSRNHNQVQSTFTRMSLVDSFLTDVKMKPESADDLSVRGYNVQSSRINRSTSRPKALINPFDPSHMTIKLTPNRRRWTHVFPQGPTGTFIQQHHYQPVPEKSSSPYLADVASLAIPEQETLHLVGKQIDFKSGSKSLLKSAPKSEFGSHKFMETTNNLANASHNKSVLVSNDTIRFAWCASGEQEWTPAITTGVDWKSLTMPACLPLTTDFFPSKTSLQNDYVIGEYTIDSSCIHSRYTLIEVYRELVCQRLQKGFQIILLPRQSKSGKQNSSMQKHLMKQHKVGAKQSSNQNGDLEQVERERSEYTMSIGRIFHKLSLNDNTITVTQYRPRHPYPTIKIDYCYRFRAPFHDTYGQSWVHFKSEKLENYSWNYLDNYICARGESFELRSSLKFWRFRILILPSGPSLSKIEHQQQLSEGQAQRFDVYPLNYTREEQAGLIDSFMKLLEIINKTRRASACRMSSSVYAVSSSASSAQNTKTNQQQQHHKQPSDQSGNSPSRLNVHMNSESELAESSSCKRNELNFGAINMDVDTALRDAKRAEWVHVQYHCFYDANQAFELVIKWMVASGAGIAEMVQGWSRKVGKSSVHIVPIPWEPFALPHSGKADPLRCPIGIQLNLSCLAGNDLNDNQVIRLQEKILRRFGFIRFHDLISSENIELQFVHLSAFAFVALPNIVSEGEQQQQDYRNNSQLNSPAIIESSQQPVLVCNQKSANATQKQNMATILKLEQQEMVSSPHEEYITRHISGARQNTASRLRGENEKVEFIWSWNYMLTKRWRSQSTQDEAYAVSLMLDFKDFCQNGHNRLVEFWHEVEPSL